MRQREPVGTGVGGRTAPSPLLVDLYEVTMAAAYHREGTAHRPATFSLFVRSLPPQRGYLVAAGLDDALDWLEHLRFGDEELAALQRLGRFDDAFLDWLATVRFTGCVRAVPEGTIVFGGEPLLEIDAPIVEGQLAETFLLNQLTLQTTLATKASRVRHAAAGRAIAEFALRRTQGIDAGMKLARVCRLVGITSTSNVAGADRYGLDASGTMAHSYIQAHEDETDAFRAFARTMGPATILLVDTYDTMTGIERALDVAREMRAEGVELRGVRLDSGDLAALSRHARTRFDQAGFPHLSILASGGLDEHDIDHLVSQERAPIDGFGVGTSLGVSKDAPVLDSVYKLVVADGRPVRKTSPGKETWPGAKQLWRSPSWDHDVLALADERAPGVGYEPLLVEVVRDGSRTTAGRASLAEANRHFEGQWQHLPAELRRLDDPPPWPVRPSAALQRLTASLGPGPAAAEGTPAS